MWFDLIILFFLLVLNGFLSMAEISLVSCRRGRILSRMSELHQAKILEDVLARPGEFLSSLQIGITVISIFSGAYSGQQLAEPLSQWLNTKPYIQGYGTPIAFGVIVISLTYVSLLISELVPKRIALAYPEQIALRVAHGVHLWTRISYFMVKVLDVSSRILLRLLGHHEQKSSSLLTEDELQYLFQQGFEDGAIDSFEHNVFRRVFQFSDLQARFLMTPQIKVVSFYNDMDLKTIVASLLDHRHRYYPVLQHDSENILGVIDSRELVGAGVRGELDQSKLEDWIRSAPIFPEDSLGPAILKAFRDQNKRVALVVDEYGVFRGIVTPYNLLEALIGSIDQPEASGSEVQVQGSWECSGLTPIQEVEVLLGIELLDTERKDDFNTLAGFVLSHFGRLPNVGEFILYEGYRFEVQAMDRQRIDRLLITLQN